MKNKKYLIPEISALSIISTARKTDDGYDFCFDSTSIPNEYRTENTLQDDCPIFHQAMCILYGEDFRNSELFTFAAEPDWKESLDGTTLERVKTLISDYETAFKRIRFLTYTEKDMKRQNDVYRILMSRGQEKDFSVDEIYTAFKAFKSLSDNCTLLDDILRMDKSTIGLPAHEINSGVLQRRNLISIKLIDLVVDYSIIVDLCEVVPLVIASAISFSLLLLQSGFSQYLCKRVAKVDGSHLAALGWTDLHFVS